MNKNLRRRISKGILLAMTVMTVSSFGVRTCLANNYTDSTFAWTYDSDSRTQTDPRNKEDDSSAYINNYGSDDAVVVNVFGYKNGTYSMCNYNESYVHVARGQARKLTNTVYENRYPKCSLEIRGMHYGQWLKGLWSPDSI